MEAILIEYITNIIIAILSLIFLFLGRHITIEQCKSVEIMATDIRCIQLKHNLYIYTFKFGLIYFLPALATIISIMASSIGIILWFGIAFYHWGLNIFVALGGIFNFLILLCITDREYIIANKITEPTYNEIMEATEEQIVLWLQQFPRIFTRRLINILLEIHPKWQEFRFAFKQANKI